jgi:mannose-1-phosphate guanylyltransferase
MHITYIKQQGTVGTGGALMGAEAILQSEPFLLIHGDILADIDLDDLISFHQESDHLASVALTSVPVSSDYGVVRVQRNRIVSFDEKPKNPTNQSNLINAGIYVLSPAIFEYLPSSVPCSLEKYVFTILAKEGKLGGYFFAGKWFDVGTPEDYDRALKGWGDKPNNH